jgi:precorrin-6B methylase 2
MPRFRGGSGGTALRMRATKGTMMTLLRTMSTVCATSLLSLSLALGPALAQAQPSPSQPETKREFVPQSGQAGKDVVWVPTPQALVDAMLDMAKAGPSDYVIDLGSGDGRTVITAAKRGIKALGIEYNPDMVYISQRAAEKEGVTDKATFRQADIFQTDFSDATVLTLFLLPSINLKLRPQILEMKPGTRVVSNSFTMDDWKADQSIELKENCNSSYCRAHLWIVPAKVGGSWKLPDGELKLTQTFQMLSGTLTRGGKTVEISEGRMNGTEIVFTADGRSYAGKVEGNRISGSDWSAERAN